MVGGNPCWGMLGNAGWGGMAGNGRVGKVVIVICMNCKWNKLFIPGTAADFHNGKEGR